MCSCWHPSLPGEQRLIPTREALLTRPGRAGPPRTPCLLLCPSFRALSVRPPCLAPLHSPAPGTEQKARRPGPQTQQHLGELPARPRGLLVPLRSGSPTPRPAPSLTATGSQTRPGLGGRGGRQWRPLWQEAPSLLSSGRVSGTYSREPAGCVPGACSSRPAQPRHEVGATLASGQVGRLRSLREAGPPTDPHAPCSLQRASSPKPLQPH